MRTHTKLQNVSCLTRGNVAPVYTKIANILRANFFYSMPTKGDTWTIGWQATKERYNSNITRLRPINMYKLHCAVTNPCAGKICSA